MVTSLFLIRFFLNILLETFLDKRKWIKKLIQKSLQGFYSPFRTVWPNGDSLLVRATGMTESDFFTDSDSDSESS
jgi:hypothetical protein